MKVRIDLFVHKESQSGFTRIRQIGDSVPIIGVTYDDYDSYTFEVDVPHKMEFQKIAAKEVPND